jgi:hypothetical protein
MTARIVFNQEPDPCRPIDNECTTEYSKVYHALRQYATQCTRWQGAFEMAAKTGESYYNEEEFKKWLELRDVVQNELANWLGFLHQCDQIVTKAGNKQREQHKQEDRHIIKTSLQEFLEALNAANNKEDKEEDGAKKDREDADEKEGDSMEK